MYKFVWILSMLLCANAWCDKALEKLVDQIQNHYDSVNTLSAKFEQTYESVRFENKQKASGQLTVKKPGKMRWDYQVPKGKVLVADGNTITLYDPKDRQAIVSKQPKDQGLPAALSFLAGKGNLKKSFNFSWIQKPKDDTAILKATPKSPEPNIKELELTVSELSHPLIVSTAVLDELKGKSQITFSKIRLNTKVSDKTFAFKVPKKATIINQ
ncbi:MAG: outer membrane lipoprotein chaperone LolA [Bdellovibrionales bacterium]|nr:outer membrane lipoprotein chaperone LolA [Bdellovibrionales bacterium]